MNVGRAEIGRKRDKDVDVTQLWTDAISQVEAHTSAVDGLDHVTDEFLSMIRMLVGTQLRTDAMYQVEETHKSTVDCPDHVTEELISKTSA